MRGRNSWTHRLTALAGFGALLAAVGTSVGGCGASESGASDFGTTAPESNVSGGGNGGGANGSNGGATGGFSATSDGGLAALPTEIKAESNYESPVATGNVVWTANPTNDEVAYIDATSFTVQTVQAGEGPTYLAAVPDPTNGNDVAIVQNAVSQDATMFSRSSQGNITVTTFASTSDANSWAISTSGRWAIAWTNASQISSPPSADSFGNMAVMDLTAAPSNGAGQSTVMAVGYRPSQVAFAGDNYAYVVTQDGISQIDLQQSPPVTSAQFPLVAATSATTTATDASAGADAPGATDASTSADAPSAASDASSDAAGAASDGSADAGYASSPADAASAVESLPPETDEDAGAGNTPDVSFTPEGTYALVRQDGLAFITVISLATGTATNVPLPSAPTDLDLSPDGTFALAVLRDTSQVAVLSIPGVVTDPAAVPLITIANTIIGRAIVTPDGSSALLFTTVTTVSDSSLLTVLTLSPPSYRTIQLHEPVLAVFPTPDSKNAVVLHTVTPTPAVNGAPAVLGAFSLVPVATTLPVQLVPVPAEPTSVAISSASDRVVIALSDTTSSTYGLDVGLFPSLQVISQTLASPPIAAGIVEGAGQGYAAQNYDEGRITFVDLYPPDGGAPGAALTITGFDLGARIVDGRDE
jgi:hypothetical protein